MKLVKFILINLLFVWSVECSTIVWRTPIAGDWFDPQNWRVTDGKDAGQIRVPKEGDDVLILPQNFPDSSTLPEFFSEGVIDAVAREKAHIVVSLRQRNNSEPIKINSLTVGMDNLVCGCPKNLTLNGIPDRVGKIISRCDVQLILSSSSLEVASFVDIKRSGVLILGNSEMDAPDSTITVLDGEIMLKTGGLLAGSGDLKSNLFRIQHSSYIAVMTVISTKGLVYQFNKPQNDSIIFDGHAIFEEAPQLSFWTDEPVVITEPLLKITGNASLGNLQIKQMFPLYTKYPPSLLNTWSPVEVVGEMSIGNYSFTNSSVSPPSYKNLEFASESYSEGYGNALCNMNFLGGLSNIGIANNEDPTTIPKSCSSAGAHDISVLFGTEGEDCPEDEINCPGNPPCGNPHWCINQQCQCPLGYFGVGCEGVECLNSCSSRGVCRDPREIPGAAHPFERPSCQCDQGWGGEDCSVPLCPNNCTDEFHGICSHEEAGPPRCICKAGWQLSERNDCSLGVMRCPGQVSECSDHGICDESTGTCLCDETWRGSDCSIQDCPGSADCSHHGDCVSTNGTNECICDQEWYGEDCAEPICTENCNSRGTCVGSVTPPRCICDAGFFGDFCQFSLHSNHSLCGGECISLKCPSTSGGDVIFLGKRQKLLPSVAGELTDCPADFNGTRRIILNIDHTLLSNQFYCGGEAQECEGHGRCDGVSCTCREGFAPGVDGLCLNAWCNEGGDKCGIHGKCNTDLVVPACECDPYFYGPLCEMNNAPCPGIYADDEYIECNGYGTCNEGVCNCTHHKGLDCSVGECLVGTNGYQCSNHGRCTYTEVSETNLTWECACFDTWTGEDCSSAKCPSDESGAECSGHGVCRLDEGTKNSCFCDKGYSGHACDKSEAGGDSVDVWVFIIVATVVLAIIMALVICSLVGITAYARRKSLWGKLNMNSVDAEIGKDEK